MALLTASANSILCCRFHPLNHSFFSHRICLPKTPNFSSSAKFLYIKSHQKLENSSGGKKNKQKQSSTHPNPSPRFTPPNHTQTAHKNEGKRPTKTNNHQNPSTENEEDSKLNKRASSEPSLSGEDILLALQRASMEKAKERSRKPKQKAKSTTKAEKERRVIGEVRPITVKAQWSAQIDSIEKRLKELKERADLT